MQSTKNVLVPELGGGLWVFSFKLYFKIYICSVCVCVYNLNTCISYKIIYILYIYIFCIHHILPLNTTNNFDKKMQRCLIEMLKLNESDLN